MHYGWKFSRRAMAPMLRLATVIDLKNPARYRRLLVVNLVVRGGLIGPTPNGNWLSR
jgi:hypothetical protein